jgi:hypothetical protein
MRHRSIHWRCSADAALEGVKRGLLILLLAAATACAGYWIYYRHVTAPERRMSMAANGEMEWLRREYHLSDAQFARIRQLHREYAPKCNLMCEKIAKANARLDQLIPANRTYTPEVEAAMTECLAVQSECRQALLAHVYAVSAEMAPTDGARYLEMMKSRIVEPGLAHTAVISQSEK